MKAVLFFLLAFSGPASFADPPLWGRWRLVSMKYDQQIIPIRTDVHFFFDFLDDGTNRLFFMSSTGLLLCERRADYSAVDGAWSEVVTWVNPDNDPSCAQKPSMRPGKETKAFYRFHKGRLEMRLAFQNKNLTYIWDKSRSPRDR